MSSARKLLSRKAASSARLPRLSRLEGLRPRVGIRIWLTALFVLVTALAAVTAYELVRPILQDTLNRASEASFRQVGEQFEAQLARNNGQVSVDQVKSFAASRGLQWGVVRAENGTKLEGELGGNLDDWSARAVQRAVAEQRPQQTIERVAEGNPREGQLRATYA